MLQFLDPYLIVGLLFLMSLFAGRISDKTKIPALLLFLFIGMLAGTNGPGGIEFDNALVANHIGSVALMFILFSGGFDTQWDEVKGIIKEGIILATVAVFATAALIAVFAWKVLRLDPMLSMLIGAIISSTDAAAVFSILRNQACGLRGSLKPLLEFESASNDPMAIFLTLTVLGYIVNPNISLSVLFGRFMVQMLLGGILGFTFGKVACRFVERMQIDNESLYPVLGIGLVLLTFGLTDSLGGNGFLALYVCGIVMGNGDYLFKRNLAKFHEGLATLMQISMFLVLGLLVNPVELKSVIAPGLLVSLFLMFVARPIGIFFTMIKAPYNINEKLFISWTGLRGAVPIILATYPLLENYPQAKFVFNLIFFVVLTSVLIQGKTLTHVAALLKVDVPFKISPRYPLEFTKTPETDNEETREVDIAADSVVCGNMVMELGTPPGVTILLIHRRNRFLIPKGDTFLMPDDTLLLFGEKKQLQNMERKLKERVQTTEVQRV